MVKPAGGGKRRRDLPHRPSDRQGKQTRQGPAQPDARSARAAQADVERREAAGQDADDGKRNGEIREAAHAPREFLPVAQLAQQLFVVRM